MEITFNGKTPKEIADRYFDSPYFRDAHTVEQQNMLKEGFVEGFEYLFPFYESSARLNDAYKRLEEFRREDNNESD